MQSDRDALLAGILADPDADLPRLVFADWLEETGHPANCARAEYIRLAIDRHIYLDVNLEDYFARSDALKRMFDDEWDTYLNDNHDVGHASRMRGFVDSANLTGRRLGDVFGELSRCHPVQDMVVNDLPVPGILTNLSPLIGLRSLTFPDVKATVTSICSFLTVSRFPRLRSLSILNCGLSDWGVVQLVHVLKENATLQRLECLDLYGNPLTDHAAHTLAATDWPPCFRRFVIDGTRITNAGREVLFRRFGFEELRPRLALS